MFSGDGAPIKKLGTYSTWFFASMLLNLHPKFRSKYSNMFLNGMVEGPKDLETLQGPIKVDAMEID
jgi:hypothetical protein